MTEKKFVVVLNKSYELVELVSGLAHVTAGLVASVPGAAEALDLRIYESGDGEQFPNISNWPFLVMRARGGQLKTLRSMLAEHGLASVCYLDTMLSGGTEVEMAATRARSGDELEILALAAFGDRDAIDPLTKKLSLWR